MRSMLMVVSLLLGSLAFASAGEGGCCGVGGSGCGSTANTMSMPASQSAAAPVAKQAKKTSKKHKGTKPVAQTPVK